MQEVQRHPPIQYSEISIDFDVASHSLFLLCLNKYNNKNHEILQPFGRYFGYISLSSPLRWTCCCLCCHHPWYQGSFREHAFWFPTIHGGHGGALRWTKGRDCRSTGSFHSHLIVSSGTWVPRDARRTKRSRHRRSCGVLRQRWVRLIHCHLWLSMYCRPLFLTILL